MTQITLQMQITIESLTEAITTLDLSEQILLRDFLDTQITQTKLSNENIVLKPAKECFRQGWQDVMTGNIQPISELWEGIDAEWFFFARRFKQDVRELSKKYRHIRSDLQTTLEEISQGNLIGNQISGVGYPVFKVRIKNSDIDKGKSGGYRLIYYIQSPEVIIIITIYSKSDQADISAKQIREIIADYKT